MTAATQGKTLDQMIADTQAAASACYGAAPDRTGARRRQDRRRAMLVAFVLLSFVVALCSDVIGGPLLERAASLVLAVWLLPFALLPIAVLGLFLSLLSRR